MDPTSPLAGLGLRIGDVVTRLDGIRISRHMYRASPGAEWTIPELDRHYGGTEVRYIFTGTQTVNVGWIVLNPIGPGPGPGPGPVLP
jgi:hypothetical protein